MNGHRSTQFISVTSIFSGRPPYVWISNHIGNTGVLTGFDEFNNTTTRPFSPDPNRYKPSTPPSGAPAPSYELALTDSKFMFPKLWRTDIGVEKLLPVGLVGTAEYEYCMVSV